MSTDAYKCTDYLHETPRKIVEKELSGEFHRVYPGLSVCAPAHSAFEPAIDF